MLNTTLIHRRRTELGLSQRALGSELRSTGTFVRNLESGVGSADLTLTQLDRLAQVLAVDVADLLEQPDAGTGSATPGDDAVDSPGVDDAAALGAVLHATAVLTPTAALAEVLGWTYDRLARAADDLDERLRRCGLRVHRLHKQLSIVRDLDGVDEDTIQEAVRRHLGRDNLNLTEARVLHRFVTEQGPPREPTNPEAVAMRVLVNAGLVEAAPGTGTSKSTTWTLAAEVRAALLLDEPDVGTS